MRFHNRVFYPVTFVIWLFLYSYFTFDEQTAEAWLISFRQWDASEFSKIWELGYYYDQNLIYFPPLFSFLNGFLSRLFTLPFHTTSLFLNLTCFFFFGVVFSQLIGRRLGVPEKGLFLFFLTSPAAHFAFTSYPDVLFCLALWTLLYLTVELHQTTFVLCAEALLYFFIPFICVQGAALVSLVFLKRPLALLTVGALALWAFAVWYIGLDPMKICDLRPNQMALAAPLNGFFQSLKGSFQWPFSGREAQLNWLQFKILPIYYFVSIAAVGIWLIFKREFVIATAVLSILIYTSCNVFWRSAVRFDLPFMALCYVPIVHHTHTRGMFFRYLGFGVVLFLGLIQFSLQIIFANVFQKGGWAF